MQPNHQQRCRLQKTCATGVPLYPPYFSTAAAAVADEASDAAAATASAQTTKNFGAVHALHALSNGSSSFRVALRLYNGALAVSPLHATRMLVLVYTHKFSCLVFFQCNSSASAAVSSLLFFSLGVSATRNRPTPRCLRRSNSSSNSNGERRAGRRCSRNGTKICCCCRCCFPSRIQGNSEGSSCSSRAGVARSRAVPADTRRPAAAGAAGAHQPVASVLCLRPTARGLRGCAGVAVCSER